MDRFEVRKLVVIQDESYWAAGKLYSEPLRKVGVCAVVANPLAGRGFVEDLSSLINPSKELGVLLGTTAAKALGFPVESYGKGGICGTAGEQEHANACLTSVFGDALREAIGGGDAWISSATKVGGPGCAIDIPLAFKDEIWVRSHYDALQVQVPGSPAPDEIAVIAVVANRGRLGARLGGMTVSEARARKG